MNNYIKFINKYLIYEFLTLKILERKDFYITKRAKFHFIASIISVIIGFIFLITSICFYSYIN